MPFRNALNSLKAGFDDLKGKVEDYEKERKSSAGQVVQAGGAPSQVPMDTHPNAAPGPAHHSSTYWKPKFDPTVPVSEEWEHKQGNNNGWGNAELEYYTSDSKNSFHTPEHKLVLRAIAVNNSSDPAQKYTSARLVSKKRLDRPKGCLTGVLSSPCASGIWPAFWLLPHEPFNWPGDGEIDIAETWNGDHNNKSCLHWGFYTPEDSQKHLTMGTDIHDMHARPVRYEFAWDQEENSKKGRMIWWIDGRAVMKAEIPDGTRPMKEWNILLNVAMGGNVLAGQTPKDGQYDFVVHELRLDEEPDNGGWKRFDNDWGRCPFGRTY